MGVLKRGLLLAGIVCSGAGVAAHAAEPASIVVLKSQDIKPYNNVVTGFRQTLKQHDPNYSITQYSLKENEDNIERIIAKIKSKPPALVLTIGSKATQLAQDNLKGLPAIFALVLNNQSLPGSMTGVSVNIPMEQQFSFIRRLIPDARVVGVICNPSNQRLLDEAKSAAGKYNLELISATADNEDAVYAAAEKLFSIDIDVLLSIPDSVVLTPQTLRYLIYQTKKRKLPFIGLSPSFVQGGALGCVYWDELDIGRQAGDMAIKVFSGTPPEKIEVAPPRKTRFYINTSTAKIIGFNIPSKLQNDVELVNHLQ